MQKCRKKQCFIFESNLYLADRWTEEGETEGTLTQLLKYLRNKDTTCEAKLERQMNKVMHRAKQGKDSKSLS